MKILCSWQRKLVKYKLDVAMAALKYARALVFKGYGSYSCHFDIDFALSLTETAIAKIHRMAPPPSRKLARMEKKTMADYRRKE